MPPANQREREAYRRIKENAYNAMHEPQVYDVTPEAMPKTNYLSGLVWTSMVATLVCAIFMGFLLYLYNQIDLEGSLQKATNHAVINLERVISKQSEEINNLKEENKKIHNHIKFWTPINCKPKEKWVIPGIGLPEIPIQRQSRNKIQRYGDFQCFSY